ncbi:MAG: hypothetical protein DRI56_03260 [Chloroflexota bacterium]|nr:MAG: hypothetical protein DRI56_03260 [Chloroflexota bacterium]
MADPTSVVTAHQNYVVDANRQDIVIKNAEPLVPFGLAALNRSLGKVEFAEVADDLIPAGLVLGASDGDNTNHLTGDSSGTYSATCRGGLLLGGGRYGGVSVTGASAITDAGKFVWATDGQTLTLTRQAGSPVGIVLKWISGTYCHVYLFSLVESILVSALSAAPSVYSVKSFGTFPTNALQGTSAVTLWTETAYEHYKFVSLHALPVAWDNAAVAGDQDLNLDIGGTDTTGGVLTLAYTDCDGAADMGTEIDATAITANNEVHVGDTVKLEMASGGTGFTADVAAAFHIYAVIERLPGV